MSKGTLSRAAELEKSKVFIASIKTRIQYSAHDIGAIIDSFIYENRTMLPVFFKDYAELCESSASPQEAVVECLELPESKAALKSGDRACLKAFFTALGTGDVDSETSLCALYEELVEERLEKARVNAEKYSGMYTLLGALAGLAATILLI